MSITIESSTDAPEAVTAALGDLAPKATATETNPAEVKAKPTDEANPETKEAGDAEAESELDASEPEEKEDEGLEAKGDETPEDDEQKPKKKGGFQKRIDKLTKRASQAEQEREYWREQALRAQTPKPETKTETQTKTDKTARPKADAFETQDEYFEALADWKADQKLAAREAQAREEQAKKEQQSKVNTHFKRVEEFKTAHDDWDDVLENVGSIQLTIPIQTAIVESENSAELMYELAKQPKELERIVSLSPLMAVKELGKFEARLAKTSEPSTETKTSKAPKPVTPVRTRGASSSKSIYDPDISQNDYEKLRAEQIKARRQSAW